jgi:hypothetical protein
MSSVKFMRWGSATLEHEVHGLIVHESCQLFFVRRLTLKFPKTSVLRRYIRLNYKKLQKNAFKELN